MLSREWRCSWSSAGRRCSNYIWVMNNLIAYWGASYIKDLTVPAITRQLSQGLIIMILHTQSMVKILKTFITSLWNFVCGDSTSDWWIPLKKEPLMQSFCFFLCWYPEQAVEKQSSCQWKTSLQSTYCIHQDWLIGNCTTVPMSVKYPPVNIKLIDTKLQQIHHIF